MAENNRLEIQNNSVTLNDEKNQYNFVNVDLVIEKTNYSNVFARYDNKTVLQTINSEKYKKFKNIVCSNYKQYLNNKLGIFLEELKNSNDNFYKKFLNPHGDEIYTTFEIVNEDIEKQKGLYIYCVNNILKYIGRCNDSFGKRINQQGYGRISPKNCYLDGQSTNCHINSLIAKNKNDVKIYVYCLNQTKREIDDIEKDLIKKYSPEWNIKK